MILPSYLSILSLHWICVCVCASSDPIRFSGQEMLSLKIPQVSWPKKVTRRVGECVGMFRHFYRVFQWKMLLADGAWHEHNNTDRMDTCVIGWLCPFREKGQKSGAIKSCSDTQITWEKELRCEPVLYVSMRHRYSGACYSEWQASHKYSLSFFLFRSNTQVKCMRRQKNSSTSYRVFLRLLIRSHVSLLFTRLFLSRHTHIIVSGNPGCLRLFRLPLPVLSLFVSCVPSETDSPHKIKMSV